MKTLFSINVFLTQAHFSKSVSLIKTWNLSFEEHRKRCRGLSEGDSDASGDWSFAEGSGRSQFSITADSDSSGGYRVKEPTNWGKPNNIPAMGLWHYVLSLFLIYLIGTVH